LLLLLDLFAPGSWLSGRRGFVVDNGWSQFDLERQPLESGSVAVENAFSLVAIGALFQTTPLVYFLHLVFCLVATVFHDTQEVVVIGPVSQRLGLEGGVRCLVDLFRIDGILAALQPEPVLDLKVEVVVVAPLEARRKQLLRLQVDGDPLQDGRRLRPQEVRTSVHIDGVEATDAEMLEFE